MGLAVSRICHKIRDYLKGIKCLNSYLHAKNDAVVLKLIAYFYRRLKNLNPLRPLQHNQQHYIQRNPRQPDVIKELYQLVEKKEKINVNEAIFLRIDEAMNLIESMAGGTGGVGLELSSVQVVKSQKDATFTFAEDLKKIIEKIDFLAQTKNSNKQNGESQFSETSTCEENEEVKFHNWAKIRGLGLTKSRPGISGISSAHIYQIVADMYKPDTTPEKLLVPSKSSESTDEFQGAVANATDEPKLFNKEHIKLKKSAELSGPSPSVKPRDFSLVAPPLVTAPTALKNNKSLQGQKPEEAKKEEEIEPWKFGETVIREGNNKMFPEHRAKLLRKKWDWKQNRKPGLGNALNLSTSVSCDKFFFGLTPVAFPATGGFSFEALDNQSSFSAKPLTRSNSNEAFRSSPFRFSAAAVASLGSSDEIDSSVLNPAQQQPRCSLHNKVEEPLFVTHAKLYRLTDGDWMMCGPGHVKIWRHYQTKTLRVVMWRDQVSRVCLNHLLTPDVVYRPMDRKSWIFAAYDSSEGKLVLERFTLRFKNKNAAQEFISAVRTALNGTAEAIKNKSEKGQRKAMELRETTYDNYEFELI